MSEMTYLVDEEQEFDIYHPISIPQTIVSGEVVDEVANIKIPIVEIFGN